MEATQDTQAGKPEVAVNLFSAFSHPGPSFLKEQWAACNAQGPSEVNCPSLIRDGHVFCYFCMFFLLGSLVEETPCEHWKNMQTPHRKAREIAHLSTVHCALWGGPAPESQQCPMQESNPRSHERRVAT